MNKKQVIRLTESDLHRIIKESVNRILNESVGEFEYSESEDLGKGRSRQTIMYNGKEIGYLVSIEKNLLSPIEEIYLLPDVDYGMSEPTDSLRDGAKGWIDFKRFTDYDEALAYASQNFEQLAYLFEYGDYD